MAPYILLRAVYPHRYAELLVSQSLGDIRVMHTSEEVSHSRSEHLLAMVWHIYYYRLLFLEALYYLVNHRVVKPHSVVIVSHNLTAFLRHVHVVRVVTCAPFLLRVRTAYAIVHVHTHEVEYRQFALALATGKAASRFPHHIIIGKQSVIKDVQVCVAMVKLLA